MGRTLTAKEAGLFKEAYWASHGEGYLRYRCPWCEDPDLASDENAKDSSEGRNLGCEPESCPYLIGFKVDDSAPEWQDSYADSVARLLSAVEEDEESYAILDGLPDVVRHQFVYYGGGMSTQLLCWWTQHTDRVVKDLQAEVDRIEAEITEEADTDDAA